MASGGAVGDVISLISAIYVQRMNSLYILIEPLKKTVFILHQSLSCMIITFILMFYSFAYQGNNANEEMLEDIVSIEQSRQSRQSRTGDNIDVSSYLGGSNYEDIWDIEVDTEGNVYVAGQTDSSDFPTTSGAFSTSKQGPADIFVSKFSPDMKNLVYSTYIGGSNMDHAKCVAINSDDIVCVGGITNSLDLYVTHGAY